MSPRRTALPARLDLRQLVPLLPEADLEPLRAACLVELRSLPRRRFLNQRREMSARQFRHVQWLPKKPVSLEEKATAGDRASVRLLEIRQIQAKARLPGEVSGPGLAITVEVDNKSADTLNLGSAVVTVKDSTGGPGAVMTGPPAKPLRGSLEEGEKATGVYVFAVPEANRDPVTMFVSVGPGTQVLSFKGPIA